MLIWQVAGGDFYSINHHCDCTVLWIHFDITVEKQLEYTCITISFQISNLVSQFPKFRYENWLFLHVRNLHTDLVLFLCLVPLQQNYEFKLCSAILSQDLIARVRHLVFVLPCVEGDQCIFDHRALSWSEQKRFICKVHVCIGTV